jgi:4-hydroxy-tetrahydrodipicolinate synthase
MFSGSMVALVTPFKEGKVDEKKLRELVNFHIKNGTNALVPCGTTGESATLSSEEHEMVIEVVIDEAQGKLPIVAGTGSNSTSEALKMTKHAKAAGADGALVITPYYNKPTPRGMYLHFEKIAKEVDIPIVLYNVPGRTGVNLLPQTVAELSKIENIVGIKEASGDLQQASDIVRLSRPDFDLISGDDFIVLPMLALGGKGVISVVANLVPDQMVALITEFKQGNLEKAKEIHYKIFPLCKAMFIETNPIPAKTAMALQGLLDTPELRLPLAPMSEANVEKLKKILTDFSR